MTPRNPPGTTPSASPVNSARRIWIGLVTAGLLVTLIVIAGGWIAEHYGWRIAFVATGLPGIALAAVVRLTIAEPPRGRFDRRLRFDGRLRFDSRKGRLCLDSGGTFRQNRGRWLW